MSDPALDPHSLGLALHDRVHDERPDLGLLVERATTSGRRLRRRRRVGSTLAAVLGVAAVATVGTQLSGGAAPSSDAPAYVASPTTGSSVAPPAAPPVATLDDRATSIRLSELMRMVSVLRDELRDAPPGSPRAEELRGLLDGVRASDGRGQTRAERVAALERLIAAFQRVEGERAAD